MRATVRDLLIGTPALTAFIPPERWFQAGAVLDTPRFPFAILRWISPVRSASGRDMKQLQVAVYDRRSTYQTIDKILGGPDRLLVPSVYSVLAGAAGVTGSDGYIAQADYLGNSGDQEDVDYKANLMFSSWQIAGRNL
jgi:hypothetical protein